MTLVAVCEILRCSVQTNFQPSMYCLLNCKQLHSRCALVLYKIRCCWCVNLSFMAKNIWHDVENFNPLIVFKLTNQSLSRQCASKSDTKVRPLVQVNSDRSKNNLNEVFWRPTSPKLIQSDIKFSNRWTTSHVVFLVPRCFALHNMFTIIPIQHCFANGSVCQRVSLPTAIPRQYQTGSLILYSNFKECKGPIQSKLSYVD